MKHTALIILINAMLAINSMASDWKQVGLRSEVSHVQPMTGLVFMAR
ncbi:MAG: hypothetical protein KBT32_01750 [Bacteroidales bacterium]|nr:hypothetical protein [Candidatus Physcocola equi]